jgi:hypothetical protein
MALTVNMTALMPTAQPIAIHFSLCSVPAGQRFGLSSAGFRSGPF